MVDRRKRDFIIILLVGMVVALLPLVMGEFYLYLIGLIGVFTILALGLNLFMGYCGQINLGSAGFFCFGAYLPTMLQIKFGWHFLIALPVTIVLSVMLAWIVSRPLLRLRGHAMAIGTLSFAMAIYLVAERFPSLTGGSDGISVPVMDLFGYPMGERFYYYFILVFVVTIYFMCYLLVESRIGRALKAVRDNEGAAAALGIDVHWYKTLAWIVSGTLGGVAGALYAQHIGFITPSEFSLWVNIVVLVMICVGGLGTRFGPVVGAVIMTSLPYVFVTMQEYTVLAQGLILFTVLRFLPAGVVGTLAKHMNKPTSYNLSRSAGYENEQSTLSL